MKSDRKQIIDNLFETMNTMKRGMHEYMQALNRDYPISRSQLELLFAVHFAQPVSSTQLAKQLHMTPGAISQLAEGIEQHGFIERRPSQTDRRIQYLHVSPGGTELIRSFEKQRRKMIEAVVADLTDEELMIWVRVQTKILAYFQTDKTALTKKET